MIQPQIGTGIKLGKPRVKVDHSRSINKSAEWLDGTVHNCESVADYERRVLGQIEGLDRSSEAESKL